MTLMPGLAGSIAIIHFDQVPFVLDDCDASDNDGSLRRGQKIVEMMCNRVAVLSIPDR